MNFIRRIFSRTLSRDDFAVLVIRALEHAGIQNASYSASDFSIRVGEGKTKAFLSNWYVNYGQAGKQQREAAIAKFAVSFREAIDGPAVPEEFTTARANLLPVIRDPSYHSLFRLQIDAAGGDAADPKLEPVTAPVADGLVVGLAYDTDHAIVQINRKMFEAWGVSFNDALSIAKGNLRDKTETTSIIEYAPGVFVGQWNDSYDSSRILLTDFMYRLPLDGEPIISIPNRDRLWMTGSQNVAGLKHILTEGIEAHFQGYPLSPNLYSLQNGAWTLYVPEDGEQKNMWLSMKHRRAGIDYEQQKKCLEAIYKRQGIDVTVANYAVYKRLDRNTDFSVCMWVKGADLLLPKAENVAFVIDPGKKDFISVPWDSALTITGTLMEEQLGLTPVRYRVRSFPDEGRLLQLRAAQRDLA